MLYLFYYELLKKVGRIWPSYGITEIIHICRQLT